MKHISQPVVKKDAYALLSGKDVYKRQDKDLNRLFTYASILRVDKTLKKYLEVLL